MSSSLPRRMTAFFHLLPIVAVLASPPASGQDAPLRSVPQDNDSIVFRPGTKIPERAILVKGAWSSATDSTTPLPERGRVANGVYTNAYFGFSYTMPAEWTQKAAGPPPSDSGSYVLTLLTRVDTYKGPARGTILITAQDMFFTPLPIANALEFVNHAKAHLLADYKLEQEPTAPKIAGRPFTSFAYWAPVAELHWHILATEIRCHTVQFILMNHDPKTLEALVEMNNLKLATASSGMAGGGEAPVCIKDYADGENVVERVNPSFTEQRANPVPVRIIIDKQGKIKHIHFLSAFPDQADAISDALAHWKFKPYLQDGKPVEVETGIMFGYQRHLAKPPVRTVTGSNSLPVASQR